MSCATLTVPLDHDAEEGDDLELAVIRVRASDQTDRIGSLVFNPGGPGASGVDGMPAVAGWLPDELLLRFDLVSFDPRGVGRSGQIECEDPQMTVENQPSPDLSTDSGWAAAGATLEAEGAACEQSLGEALGLYSTDAMTRDLDLLREALGDEALNYVGWSYGARLGAHYARLFPDRVRALALDGPPAATATRFEVVESQIAGFEQALSTYAADCPTRPTCQPLGDVRVLFERILQLSANNPIPSGRPVDDPPATRDVVIRATLGFLASPELWPFLDAALDEADQGDSGSLYDMIDSLEGRTADRPSADTDDAATVILCNDSAPNALSEQNRADAAQLSSRYTAFGAYGAFWLLSCSSWPGAHGPLPTTPIETNSPVLVIATESDPSTPASGASDFVETLGSQGVLVTWSGEGHTAFGRSSCVAALVTRYLVELATPGTGSVCSDVEA
ncbi:MAG: alpha/beta hydrolase [Pseudolysinimonas sp.]